MLVIVNYFGHEFGYSKVRTIQFKISAVHKIPPSPTKIELMRFIRSMNFFSNLKGKLRNNLKALYDLLLDSVEFHWNITMETLFQQTKTSITKDVTLTLPNENHPFFEVDSFWIGKGCILYWKINKGKLDIFSNVRRTSQLMNKNSFLRIMKKLWIVSSLTECYWYFFRSDHLIDILRDHKQIFSCFTKKGNFTSNFHCTITLFHFSMNLI